MKSQKILVYESHFHLHGYIYEEAIKKLNCKVDIYKSTDKRSTLQDAINHALNNSYTCLYLITLDGNINLELIKAIVRAKLNKQNMHLITNLFGYHKINNVSLKSILFLSLIALSRKVIVFTSDPMLRERYYYKALRKNIRYCPDFILDRENISPYDLEVTDLPFKLPSKKPIIGVYGRLNDKKSISKLTSAIKEFLREGNKLNYMFVFAGPAGDLPHEVNKTLEELSASGTIIYHPYLIKDSSLYKLISISYVIWVVQENFWGSSGIFTRACAYGIPPIVAESSTLGRITSQKNLGYCLNDKNFYESFKNLLYKIGKTKRHSQIKANAHLYSEDNSESKFLEIMSSTINHLS